MDPAERRPATDGGEDETAPADGADDCQYTHEIDDDRFADLPGDTWECPHPAPAAATTCPFHRERTGSDTEPVEATSWVSDDSPAAVAGSTAADTPPDGDAGGLGALLASQVDGADPATNRFLGATFGQVALSYAVLRGPTNHPIDCREASFGGLSLADATIGQPLRLEGATVGGDLTADGARFEGGLWLTDATVAGVASFEDASFERRFDAGRAAFDGRVDLRLARFDSWMDLRDAELTAGLYARNARFTKGVYGVGARFGGAADLVNATFDKVCNLKRACFDAGLNLGSAEADDSLDLRGARLDGPLDPVRGGAGGEVKEKYREFDGAGWFDGLEVGKDARFTDATLGGDLRFREATIDGALDLDPAGVADDADEDHAFSVDCRGATVAAGRIDPPEGAVAVDLGRATVGDVTLAGADPFARTRVHDTTFDGFDFGAAPHRSSLTRADYRFEPDGPDGEPVHEADMENTYLKAKNGAAGIGASGAAAEFFRRQLTARRAGHRRRALEAEGVGTRLVAAGRYLANATLALTAGYGERPSRTILSSFGVVALFAVGFLTVLRPRPESVDAGFALLFSFQSFIAFLVGPPPAAGLLVRSLSALEGFVGAFLIALFVFTLTRSVHR